MRNSWARNVRGMKDMADVLASIGRERQKNFLSYCQHLIRENLHVPVPVAGTQLYEYGRSWICREVRSFHQ